MVKRGEFEPGLAVLTKAVAINSKGYDRYYALGVAQYRLKRSPESAD